MFSLKIRLLLLTMPFALAALGAIGYANYFKSTEMFTGLAEDYLQTIVGSKQAALLEYFESTERIGGAIAATEIVQSYVALTNRNLEGRNRETVEELGRRVENLLYSFQEAHWGRYRHIYLIDRSLRIVISPHHGIREKGTPSSLLERDMSPNPWAVAAMNKGKPTITNYTRPVATEPWQQSLFFPVRDASNRVQAVIGFELQTSYQQQILLEGLPDNLAHRVYLATDKGLAVTQTRVERPPPLTGPAISEARLNGAATARRVNSEGREVIGHYARRFDDPWLLAAEIESDEIFAELYELQIWLAAGIGATLLLLMILMLRFANHVIKPVRELTSRVELLSLGKFSTEIPDAQRKDEIGKLFDAFQRLVFSLQLVAKKLRQAKAMKRAG